jgi:hypothetical protein
MSSKQFISISIGNKALNININISELSKVGGSLNISLNDLTSLIEASQAQTTPVVVAKVVDETRNVTMRKKPKAKKQLIIEEDDEVEKVEVVQLCKPVKSKTHKSKYAMDDDHNFMCPHCSEFKTKKMNTLSMHIAAKHGDENKHVCEYDGCGKRFPILTRLQHHITNHHNVKYLQCPFPNCEYANAKKTGTLYTHYVRQHMDYESMCTNKSQCNGCGEEKNDSIYYHLATCHKSSPFYKSSSQSSAKK